MIARRNIRALYKGARFARCCEQDRQARVLSVHRKVINIQTEDELLALALPQAGGSSRFLCLNLLPELSEGAAIRLTPTSLTLEGAHVGAGKRAYPEAGSESSNERAHDEAGRAGDDEFVIDLRNVPLWQSPLPPWTHAELTPSAFAAFSEAVTALQETEDGGKLRSFSAHDALLRAFSRGTSLRVGAAAGAAASTGAAVGLAAAVSNGTAVEPSCELTPQTVARWIGFGPGLTPAGDDVLLGYLAADNHLGADCAWTQALHKAVASNLERTTTLSAQLLKNALAGDYHESVQRVLMILCGLSAENLLTVLRRLARIGASSGECTIYGMWLALERIAGAGDGDGSPKASPSFAPAILDDKEMKEVCLV